MASQPFYDTRTTEYVSGRQVLGSGNIVMLRSDTEAEVHFDNFRFIFAFIQDPGRLVVDTQLIDDSTLRVRFTGEISPLGISYELPHVGTWNMQSLHLAIMIHAISESQVARQVSYTLSCTPLPPMAPVATPSRGHP